jgi:WD40 repeat protein
MAQPWMFPYFVANAQDVSCVEWSPDGSLLVVGHNSSPVVAIWDVALHKATILSRGALDTTALRFSSDGSYLLQTISGNGIHIWETRTWDMQKMATGSSCNSIQWIPNSKMFMFSLQGSNKIHLLQMKSEPPNLEVTNAPSLDLPTLTHPRVQSHMNLPIESLHLDPTGSRLAVVFENTHEVGLYQLRMRPLPDLSPMYDCFNDSGWIYGPSDSKRQPQPRFATKFQPGALLSVQWDKTTIGFIPLYIK